MSLTSRLVEKVPSCIAFAFGTVSGGLVAVAQEVIRTRLAARTIGMMLVGVFICSLHSSVSVDQTGYSMSNSDPRHLSFLAILVNTIS